jgi:hypothetical protein
VRAAAARRAREGRARERERMAEGKLPGEEGCDKSGVTIFGVGKMAIGRRRGRA